MTPRHPVRIRQGNTVIRKERSDGVRQGYHVGPQVTSDPEARAALHPRPSRDPFAEAAVTSEAPDLTGARFTQVGHRRGVFITDSMLVLEAWNRNAFEYRAVPHTPRSMSALRATYPKVSDE